MAPHDLTEEFELHRRTLTGVAYRMLGSTEDAADAVQDTYLAWRAADHATIRSSRAWLITVCTRRAIDMATSASRTRVEYVGEWLPDFVHTEAVEDPSEQAALASTITTAFLLLLDRLSPRERAAFVLREIFDIPYSDIAETLGLSEPACRQLIHRARGHVGEVEERYQTPPDRQHELLEAFRAALVHDDVATLERMLADDVVLIADSGGKVPTVRHTLHGGAEIIDFIRSTIGPYWRRFTVRPAQINGNVGLELVEGDRLTAAVTFDFDPDGDATRIFVMRNPEKLSRLAEPTDLR